MRSPPGRARRPASPAERDRLWPVADRAALHAELDRAADSFRQLVLDASPGRLRRRSAGTRWTNRQLLFHMVFGYLLVLRLLPLVRLFGRLPEPASRGFAAILQAGTRPFHVVNYLGSWGGGTALSPAQMLWLLERVIDRLHRRLDAEQDSTLGAGMHFPTGWDPYFTDVMTLADVYHFATQHFDHHRKQLTLDGGDGRAD
jgi:hypothetical protein